MLDQVLKVWDKAKKGDTHKQKKREEEEEVGVYLLGRYYKSTIFPSYVFL